MPLFYQQDINDTTRLGVWRIEEEEDFFLRVVPLQQAITHPQKRLQHLAGRYLLPFLYPGFPYRSIEIADTRKPFLPEEEYHFSISHCSNYAAAIVSSEARVGIDIEKITPRVEKIKHKFLHPEELDFVHTHEENVQVALLTLLWSCKEALFKWWGRGDVDFSEVLRIEKFRFSGQGTIPAKFCRDGRVIPLELQYVMMEDLSMAWVVQGGTV